MNRSSPQRVLVAGSGVEVEALLALQKLAKDRVELELLCPQRVLNYRPLTVAAPFGEGEPAEVDVMKARRRCWRIAPSRSLDESGSGAEDGVDISWPEASLRHACHCDRCHSLARGPRAPDVFRAAGHRTAPAAPARGRAGAGRQDRIRRSEWSRLATTRVRARAADRGFGGEPWTGQCGTHPGNTGMGDRLPSSARPPVRLSRNCSTGYGIEFVPSSYPVRFERGELESLRPRFVLARSGCRSSPDRGTAEFQDSRATVTASLRPIYGLVSGVSDVYAAGDATTFPIKQGESRRSRPTRSPGGLPPGWGRCRG